mmetsp:Transcript_22420/g.59990  ORF Transcript_22420/g.59990 Transcript_22420/m.59990 type:complete len:312 (+) Transcript_22420:359-1294(+)
MSLVLVFTAVPFRNISKLPLNKLHRGMKLALPFTNVTGAAKIRSTGLLAKHAVLGFWPETSTDTLSAADAAPPLRWANLCSFHICAVSCDSMYFKAGPLMRRTKSWHWAVGAAHTYRSLTLTNNLLCWSACTAPAAEPPPPWAPSRMLRSRFSFLLPTLVATPRMAAILPPPTPPLMRASQKPTHSCSPLCIASEAYTSIKSFSEILAMNALTAWAGRAAPSPSLWWNSPIGFESIKSLIKQLVSSPRKCINFARSAPPLLHMVPNATGISQVSFTWANTFTIMSTQDTVNTPSSFTPDRIPQRNAGKAMV